MPRNNTVSLTIFIIGFEWYYILKRIYLSYENCMIMRYNIKSLVCTCKKVGALFYETPIS
jgi:hypothetical protein